MSLNTKVTSVSPLNFNQLFAEFLQIEVSTVEQHVPLKIVSAAMTSGDY